MQRSLVSVTFAAVGVTAAMAINSASAAPVVIEDFTDGEGAGSFGTFTWGVGPSGSGSNQGASGGTSTVPIEFDLVPGTHVNRISVIDDNFVAPNGSLFFGQPAAWNLRHVSNAGNPSSANLVSSAGGVGWFGFYLRTTTVDLFVAPALDEVGGSTGTELGSRIAVIADGEWHLYQWNLGDDTQWDPLFGSSNGSMDGTAYSIDSINFWNAGPENGETSTFELAYLLYDAEGPLVAIPEPASFALLSLGALTLVRRRRH